MCPRGPNTRARPRLDDFHFVGSSRVTMRERDRERRERGRQTEACGLFLSSRTPLTFLVVKPKAKGKRQKQCRSVSMCVFVRENMPTIFWVNYIVVPCSFTISLFFVFLFLIIALTLLGRC